MRCVAGTAETGWRNYFAPSGCWYLETEDFGSGSERDGAEEVKCALAEGNGGVFSFRAGTVRSPVTPETGVSSGLGTNLERVSDPLLLKPNGRICRNGRNCRLAWLWWWQNAQPTLTPAGCWVAETAVAAEADPLMICASCARADSQLSGIGRTNWMPPTNHDGSPCGAGFSHRAFGTMVFKGCFGTA